MDKDFLIFLLNVWRQLVPTKTSDQLRFAPTTIAYFNVVIDAAIVLLQLKRLKLKRHLVVWRGGNTPNAFLTRHVF